MYKWLPKHWFATLLSTLHLLHLHVIMVIVCVCVNVFVCMYGVCACMCACMCMCVCVHLCICAEEGKNDLGIIFFSPFCFILAATA